MTVFRQLYCKNRYATEMLAGHVQTPNKGKYVWTYIYIVIIDYMTCFVGNLGTRYWSIMEDAQSIRWPKKEGANMHGPPQAV